MEIKILCKQNFPRIIYEVYDISLENPSFFGKNIINGANYRIIYCNITFNILSFLYVFAEVRTLLLRLLN